MNTEQWIAAHHARIAAYEAAWHEWEVTVEHLVDGPEAEAANVQWDAWSAGRTALEEMRVGQAYRIDTPQGTLIQEGAL